MQTNSSSVRGGYRENAGRKSSWNHSDTCTIRIPKSFAEQLIELARRLDNGEIIDTETKSNSPNFDTVAESISSSSGSLTPLGCQPEAEGAFDNETESFSQEFDNATESNISKNQTLTQSIPDIKEALAQAITIVKAKKSAKESMARLLSKLYSTQVSPDDLK